VRGAGTVVTGTLTAGTLAVGDTLQLAPEGRQVTVRGLQCFGADRESVTGPARVAVNLRRVPADAVRRGHALVTPGRWRRTDTVDVRLADGTDARELPAEPLVHCGTLLTGARVRPLGGPLARLRTQAPLDLRVGDRLLLRDPGSRRLTAARVLDPAPPRLARRGAAAARAAALTALPPDGRDAAAQLRLRGLTMAAELAAMGLTAPDEAVVAGEWLLAPGHAQHLHAALAAEVRAHARAHPEDPGLPVARAAAHLGLPSPTLVPSVAAWPGTVRPPAGEGHVAAKPGETREAGREIGPGPERAPAGRTSGRAREGGPLPRGSGKHALVVRDGRVYAAEAAGRLPRPAAAAAQRLEAARQAAGSSFHAPTRPELEELGVTAQHLVLLVRHGLLERYDTVHLAAGSACRAAETLRAAPQPFSVGECCRALDVPRRVAIPLLEHLDRTGITRRNADGRLHVLGLPAAVRR
jgi:selenocysteine-specific elongation factor